MTSWYPGTLPSFGYFMAFSFVEYSRNPASGAAVYTSIENIYLPVPLNLQEEYHIEYEGRKIGMYYGSWEKHKNVAKNLANAGKTMFEHNAMGFLNQNYKSWGDAGKDIADLAGMLSQFLGPESFQDSSLGTAITQAAGFVPNPHLTTMFGGVEPRAHEFTWMFSPRNSTDAKVLEEVINKFRAYSHPRYRSDLDVYALQFPYQVYANFVGTNYLYPMKRAYITDVNIRNSGDGQAAFYADGALVQVELTIRCREVEILTAADFAGQYSYTSDGGYAVPPPSSTTPTSQTSTSGQIPGVEAGSVNGGTQVG